MNRRTDNLEQGKRRYLNEGEVAGLLETELQKPARRMDMELILEGLNYFYPFDAQADAAEAELALNRFLEKYPLLCTEGKRIGMACRKKLVLIAATILLLILGVCSALGVWKVAYQWLSDSLFMRITSEGGAVLQTEGQVQRATEIWGDALYDLMEEHGINISLPGWMPEKMELVYAEATELEDGYLIIDAIFSVSSDKRVSLTIANLNQDAEFIEFDINHYHERDYLSQKEMVIEKIDFHTFTNIDHTTVSWSEGNIAIQLDIPHTSENEIMKIIESIRKE